MPQKSSPHDLLVANPGERDPGFEPARELQALVFAFPLYGLVLKHKVREHS